VLAPNASPMTLDGTNTWVLRDPSSSRSVVIDPGPADEGHLDAVADAAGEVAVVLLTHHHLDHSEAARAFAERVGCGVRALDPAYRLGPEGLGEGDVVAVDDLEVHVVATPGHTADSLTFHLPADGAVLTGDTVLGRGTTVIADDGRLGPYLDSLRLLRELAGEQDLRVLLPGHGPLLADPAGALDYYLAHRAERLGEVRAALAAGDRAPAQIVERVYADVPRVLWPAAAMSVRAQLGYLAERGELPPGTALA
jgi:glyoxylase-like metal-dependent hydrolase (beta-lactamase superfamily II)